MRPVPEHRRNKAATSSMLTGRDRVVRAICHEEPDRVPVFEPYGVLPPTADELLGRPCVATSNIRGARLFASRGPHRYSAVIRRDWHDLVRTLGFDAAPLAPGGHYTPKATPRMLGRYAWSVGDSVYRHHPDTMVTVEVDSKIRREGIPALEEHVKGMEEETDDEIEEAVMDSQIDEELSKTWQRLGVLIYAGSGTVPVGASWIAIFLKCFHLNPRLIRRYLRQRTRRAVIMGKVAADLGVELMFIGGDIAGNDGPMISPEKYRRFLLPEMKAQADAMHRRGIFAFISSDGNLWPIIEDYLIGSGVDGMMEIQVPAGMDLGRLKELYGGGICFAGSVDAQFTLVRGGVKEVERETRGAIDILSPGGGHILCSSNSIHSGVKPANFLAMLKAARRFGRYQTA